MTMIGTCGDELSEEWFDSRKGEIAIKDRAREGDRAISYLIVCEKCLPIYEEDRIKTKQEQDKWIKGEKI